MVMQDGRSYGCCACIGSAGVAVANLATISAYNGGFSVNLYNSFTFKTDSSPRTIFLDGVSNTRDTGGYKSINGKKLKQGMIFRGGSPDDIKIKRRI